MFQEVMFNYSGFSVPMKNSEKEIKNIADFFTDTNNNDGVAKAIERLME